MNIFVAKLSASTRSEDLERLFSEYGTVSSAKVIMDRDTGNSKRYGFVEMDDDEEGMKAINELNECEYDNSTIIVKKARPREDNRRSGGGDRFNNNRGGNNFNRRY